MNLYSRGNPMNWLHQQSFKLFTRIFFTLIILGYPLNILASERVHYDDKSNIVNILAPLQDTDEEFRLLMERLTQPPVKSPEHKSGDISTTPWKVINQAKLDIGFELFSQLTNSALFFNSGDVVCNIDSANTPLTLGSLENDGDITFQASHNSVNPLSELILNIQS